MLQEAPRSLTDFIQSATQATFRLTHKDSGSRDLFPQIRKKILSHRSGIFFTSSCLFDGWNWTGRPKFGRDAPISQVVPFPQTADAHVFVNQSIVYSKLHGPRRTAQEDLGPCTRNPTL